MRWSQKYLDITVAEEAIREIEEVKSGDEKYFGDRASKSFSFTWSEIDPLPQAEYEKMEKLRKNLDKALDEDPDMTEDEANLLLSKIDNDTVKKYNIRIKDSSLFFMDRHGILSPSARSYP